MMKIAMLGCLFLAFNFNVVAQNWHTNMTEVKQIASKENESILLVFQGSDWCAPCMKLDREIFQTEEFQTLAKKKFVMMKADFPRKKANKLTPEIEAQNALLAETYNTQGFFPLVVVMDKNGKVLGKIGYENVTPKAYFNKLSAFK